MYIYQLLQFAGWYIGTFILCQYGLISSSLSPFPPLSLSPSPVPSPTSTPTEAPPTTEDPIQRHLAAIIGVPTGIGLAVLLIGSCVVWLLLTSYLRYRRAEREQATNTTHLVSPPITNLV